jgi:hypothetical protein
MSVADDQDFLAREEVYGFCSDGSYEGLSRSWRALNHSKPLGQPNSQASGLGWIKAGSIRKLEPIPEVDRVVIRYVPYKLLHVGGTIIVWIGWATPFMPLNDLSFQGEFFGSLSCLSTGS